MPSGIDTDDTDEDAEVAGGRFAAIADDGTRAAARQTIFGRENGELGGAF